MAGRDERVAGGGVELMSSRDVAIAVGDVTLVSVGAVEADVIGQSVRQSVRVELVVTKEHIQNNN